MAEYLTADSLQNFLQVCFWLLQNQLGIIFSLFLHTQALQSAKK